MDSILNVCKLNRNPFDRIIYTKLQDGESKAYATRERF